MGLHVVLDAVPREGQAVPLGGQHLDELPAAGDQRGQILLRGVGERPRLGPDVRRKPRQHVRIQGVGLGEAPDRFGKVADLPRIDDGDRQPRQRERRRDIGFIAAGRLEDDQRRRQRLHLRDERTQPGFIVGKPRAVVAGDVATSRCAFATSRPT